MITALDIINDEQHLPITHIQHDRKWRKSQVSPMGGRIVFELMLCEASGNAPAGNYVRVNINDGITALPDCQDGPGKSCSLSDFAARTKRRGEEAGNFVELCELDDGAAHRVSFLQQ